MGGYEFKKLELEGSYLIDCFYVGDSRGGFSKYFVKELFEENGIEFNLSETFVSISAKNVIRGLHFQLNGPQAKLVCVPKGRIIDFIVDIRPESKTFGQWKSYELSGDNHRALFIPRGFAHGFVSLEDDTYMMYQCDGKYDKETDTGIRFDDPAIGIEWPIDIKDAITSQRDLTLMSFEEYKQRISR